MTFMCLALRDWEFTRALLILSTISVGLRWSPSLMLSGRKQMTTWHGWCAVSGLGLGFSIPWFVSGLPLGLKVGPVTYVLLWFVLCGVSELCALGNVVFSSRAVMWAWVSVAIELMDLSWSAITVALYRASSQNSSTFFLLLSTFLTRVVTKLLICCMAFRSLACWSIKIL